MYQVWVCAVHQFVLSLFKTRKQFFFHLGKKKYQGLERMENIMNYPPQGSPVKVSVGSAGVMAF